jgi:hypothetical protein
MENKIPEEIARKAKIQLAKRFFWDYCKLKAPKFFKDDREYLKDLANRLQAFMDNKDKKVFIVNMGPRHGKSFTATLFTQWLKLKEGKRL